MRWKECCKKEIARIWKISGGPMEVVRYVGECPDCRQFIGLTQTSQEEADKFLTNIKMNKNKLEVGEIVVMKQGWRRKIIKVIENYGGKKGNVGYLYDYDYNDGEWKTSPNSVSHWSLYRLAKKSHESN